MQFQVIAYDGEDAAAPARRLASRPAYIDGIKAMIADGRLIAGGAILDEGGQMIGSTVLVDFPDRGALDAWLKADPYVTGDVWRKVEVRPVRLVHPTSA